MAKQPAGDDRPAKDGLDLTSDSEGKTFVVQIPNRSATGPLVREAAPSDDGLPAPEPGKPNLRLRLPIRPPQAAGLPSSTTSSVPGQPSSVNSLKLRLTRPVSNPDGPPAKTHATDRGSGRAMAPYAAAAMSHVFHSRRNQQPTAPLPQSGAEMLHVPTSSSTVTRSQSHSPAMARIASLPTAGDAAPAPATKSNADSPALVPALPDPAAVQSGAVNESREPTEATAGDKATTPPRVANPPPVDLPPSTSAGGAAPADAGAAVGRSQPSQTPTKPVAASTAGSSSTTTVHPPASLEPVVGPPIADGLLQYEMKRKLGEGTYGEVFLAIERKTSQPVAIKKLKVLESMEGLPTTTLREIMILRSLPSLPNSTHFANLREVVMAPDYRELSLVFDFVEHSLFGLLAAGVPFTEADVRCIFRQVLRGLSVLHDAQIVHRDVKPNNVLVCRDGTVKLCDFGLAFSLTSNRQRVTPRLVALAYRPPEMLLNAKTYSSAVDVWSTGCMLAQVFLGGAPPFMVTDQKPANDDVEQLAVIAAAHRCAPEHVASVVGCSPAGVSTRTMPYTTAQLAQNLEAHLSEAARKRRRPPIPKAVLRVISSALTLDPSRRPSSRDLLNMQWFAHTVSDTVERSGMANRVRAATGSQFCHTAQRR